MLRTQLYLAGLFALTSSACRYDLDGVFAPGKVIDDDSTVEKPDSAVEMPEPEDLVALLGSGKFSSVDDACVACAEEKCDDVRKACEDDPDCVAFNRCVSASTDPATQAECRARFVDWLRKDIPGRDMGGPYQQCVFQDRCWEECKGRSNFQCAGKFSWPTTGADTVPYRIRFVEALSAASVGEGLEVKVCRSDDTSCSVPAATAYTDENGEVALDLLVTLRAFRGYLELNKEGFYPTLLRLGWPIAQEGVTNISIINRQSVELNISLAGVKPDPERGLLQVRFFSCAGFTAPGVSFTTNLADAASRSWYANDIGLPSFEGESTSLLGAGGVINAVEGVHLLVARDAETGKKIAETSAPVRPGYMTIVLFAPLESK